METITDRFLLVYNFLKDSKIVKNAAQMAKDMGITPAAISNIVSGSSKAELKIVTGIAKAYTAVNLRWLLIGDGEMLVTKTPPADNAEGVNKVESEDSLTELLKQVKADQESCFANLKSILNQVLSAVEKPEDKLSDAEAEEKAAQRRAELMKKKVPAKNPVHKQEDGDE